MKVPDPHSRYLESFPQTLSVRRKTTPDTEKKQFHLHEQMELVVPVSDNLACRYEGGSLAMPAGSILLLDSMTLHYITRRSAQGLADRYVLYFSPESVTPLSTPELDLLGCFYLPAGPAPRLVELPPSPQAETFQLLDSMVRQAALAQNNPPGTMQHAVPAVQVRLLLGQLLALVCGCCLAPGQTHAAPAGRAAAMFAVREYIRRHCCEPLTADALAREFYLSRTQLYQAYRSVFGVTVGEAITQYRLARAKDLLINTDDSIEWVARRAGYQNLSAFSRLFKAKVGLSPNEFRRRGRA